MEGEHSDRDTQVRLDQQGQTIVIVNISRDLMVPTVGCPKTHYQREEKGVCHHWAGGGDIWEEWTNPIKVYTIISIMSLTTWTHSSPTT